MKFLQILLFPCLVSAYALMGLSQEQLFEISRFAKNPDYKTWDINKANNYLFLVNRTNQTAPVRDLKKKLTKGIDAIGKMRPESPTAAGAAGAGAGAGAATTPDVAGRAHTPPPTSPLPAFPGKTVTPPPVPPRPDTGKVEPMVPLGMSVEEFDRLMKKADGDLAPGERDDLIFALLAKKEAGQLRGIEPQKLEMLQRTLPPVAPRTDIAPPVPPRPSTPPTKPAPKRHVTEPAVEIGQMPPMPGTGVVPPPPPMPGTAARKIAPHKTGLTPEEETREEARKTKIGAVARPAVDPNLAAALAKRRGSIEEEDDDKENSDN